MSFILIVIAISAVALMLGAGLALMTGVGQAGVQDRMDQFVGRVPVDVEIDDRADKQQDDMADKLDRAMEGRGFFTSIREGISRANVRLRVSEYIAFVIGASAVAAFLAYRFFDGQILLVAGAALVGSRIPRIYLNVAAKRRIRAYDNQLGDTLNLWVNSLRSGYSVMQGMEAIAAELPAPVSEEFERVVQEVRLGLGLNDALENMLRRVPSEDLDLVVTAINIQREVGGNLTEILEIISYTIRERVRIKGEIQTLTAQGRISGWTITLLPVVLAFVLYGINRDYVSELIVKEKPFIIPEIFPCGWAVLAVSIIMISIGAFAIQKIVDIEV